MTYADCAMQYHRAGWHPLPLIDSGKGLVPSGFTGYHARKVTTGDIDRWVEEGLGNRNVCLRLMYEVGIDVDAYSPKRGGGTLDALEEKYGPLPATVRVSARFGAEYDGKSGIRLYRLPEKYRHLVEAAVWNSQAGMDVDIIRLGHRQAVVWPSIHPKRGTPYQYLDERDGTIVAGPLPEASTLPVLPDAWVENVLLKADKPKAQPTVGGKPSSAPKAGPRIFTNPAESQWWSEGTMCKATSKALGKAVTKMHGGRYDNMVKAMLSITRLGEQGHEGVAEAIDSLHGHYISEVTSDGSRTSSEAEGEWLRAAANVDGVIDSAGLTPPHMKGCCARKSKGTTLGGIVGASDPAVAERIALDALSTEWRYIASEPGQWMRWTGKRWRDASVVEVIEVVRQWARDGLRWAVDTGQPDAEVNFRARLATASKINALAQLLRGVPTICTQPEEWADDLHPYLLNCENGVLDLRTKTLMPHDPSRLITKITNAEYIPGAKHPDWTVARRAFADPAVEEYMQRYFGTGCIGHQPSGGAMVVLHGGGLNGKSTITGSVAAALGEYARGQLPSSLIGGDFEPRPHEVMELKGLRFGLFEETSDGYHFNVAAMKRIVDTPSQTGSRKYKAQVTFPNTGTLMLNTNHRPVVKEADDGTWRRLVLVPFPHRFAGADGVPFDPTLRRRLQVGERGRAEAVLAWVVEGAHRYITDDESLGEPPTTIKEATEEWRENSDLIAQFIRAECVFTPGAFTATSDLLSRFNSWMVLSDLGKHEWSSTLFSQRFEGHRLLVENSVTKGRKRIGGSPNAARGFHDIGLTPLGGYGGPWGGRSA